MYSALLIVTAPAIEPVTVDETKRFLRISHDADDTDIEGLITAARILCERWCRRCFITTRLRWAVAQDTDFVGVPMLPYIVIDPPVPARMWELPRSSVTAVHSVTLTADDGTQYLLTADQYRYPTGVNPTRIELTFNPTNRVLMSVVTEFTAGYGPAASDVPPTVRTAIKSMVGWLYENRGDQESPDFPVTMRRLLAGDRVYSA